jgi:hypothetical protein
MLAPAKERLSRVRVLVGSVTVAAGLLLVAGLVDVATRATPGPRMNMVKPSQSTMLYDIPNFVYQRTQMHFPQAEENWLNMAAEGKVGDDVKPEKVLNNLNGIISEARTHALTENYEARVKAKKDAMEENYDEYDVHKGRVIHKIYGKQVGGSMTLKPKGVQGQMLAQQPAQQPQYRRQQALAQTQQMVSFGVVVPQGLQPGQRFIAQIPGHGQELVTVPPRVKAGQEVAIMVPAAGAKAAHAKPALRKQPAAVFHKVFQHSSLEARRASAKRKAAGALPKVGALPHIKVNHPFAAEMVNAALSEHYNSVNHKVYGLEH